MRDCCDDVRRSLCKKKKSGGRLYHSCPIPVFDVPLSRPADALRFVQAKKTIVKLSYDVFGAQEVVEDPLFSQTTKVGPEYGSGVGSKVAGLVDSDEEVFELKGV